MNDSEREELSSKKTIGTQTPSQQGPTVTEEITEVEREIKTHEQKKIYAEEVKVFKQDEELLTEEEKNRTSGSVS